MLVFICILLAILLIISFILLALSLKNCLELKSKKDILVNKNSNLIDENEDLKKQIFTLQLKLKKLEKPKKESKKTTTKKPTKKTEEKTAKKSTRKTSKKEDK